MKKRNLLKKIASVTLAATMFLSLMTVTANAGAVLLDPAEGDICTQDNSYVTQVKDPETGIITGRNIVASGITSAVTVSKTEDNSFRYRTYALNADKKYAFSGPFARFKNNHIWEFDFCFNNAAPAKPSSGGGFYIRFGSHWANEINFTRFDDTKYYVGWNTNSLNSGNDRIISAANTSSLWAGSVYSLEANKTYRLRIEADLRNDRLYVTFTNPNLAITQDAEGKPVYTKLDAPQWDNPNIYTKTTTNDYSKYSLGFTQSDLASMTNGANRLNILIQARADSNLTLSNEKFYIDKFVNTTPEITTDGSKVTATTNAVNITGFNYTANLCTLLCGVYTADDKLVASDINTPYVQSAVAMEANEYSAEADITKLADGTYKVKAFVWNSINKMQPYDNCLVENTLTITDGVAAITE